MGRCLEADSKQSWLIITAIFYSYPDIYIATRLPRIIGDKTFRAWTYEKRLPQLIAEQHSHVIQTDLTMTHAIRDVASEYDVTEEDITKVDRGQ